MSTRVLLPLALAAFVLAGCGAPPAQPKPTAGHASAKPDDKKGEGKDLASKSTTFKIDGMT
jgi:hypothetical protein